MFMIKRLDAALNINRSCGTHREERLGDLQVEGIVRSKGLKEAQMTFDSLAVHNPFLDFINGQLSGVLDQLIQFHCSWNSIIKNVHPVTLMAIIILGDDDDNTRR